MTTSEVAEYLGVSRQTIYAWSNYGDLPCRQVNSRLKLFSKEKIDEWVRKDFKEVKST
ncbi:helix-turn-helix domain-containing protein [Listeria grayi]|uniref:helix-turn-helix domain-containing protein n=1 Tax=Listeria grayi TaxID=1641 RepID=UPI0021AB1F3A|nr:helix-turn-helix domain-containing protein [Listeria grayi]